MRRTGRSRMDEGKSDEPGTNKITGSAEVRVITCNRFFRGAKLLSENDAGNSGAFLQSPETVGVPVD